MPGDVVANRSAMCAPYCDVSTADIMCSDPIRQYLVRARCNNLCRQFVNSCHLFGDLGNKRRVLRQTS
jgi:hypothetical protein